MRSISFIYLVMTMALVSCGSPANDPASVAPTPSIKELHFEDAFFAMDTLHFEASLAKLVQKYPAFSDDYFNRILMMSPQKESKQIGAFHKAYLPVYKEAKKVQASKLATPQIVEALKRFHYYFPNYTLPKQVIYFIGPLETYGNVVTKDGLAIGLQLYLGSESSWYFSEQINTIYPRYISRQFAPEYIVVNSLQNILNDYQPIALNGTTLVAQMIEIGKRQYILEQCLPKTQDTILMGYTGQQLEALKENTGDIWTFLASQNRLFSVDPTMANSILGEAPYNDYFGEDIPGNVGKYIGYTIVKSWMEQQKGKTKNDLDVLLKMPAMDIFNKVELDF